MTTPLDRPPDYLAQLQAALATEREARLIAEARAAGAEAMVEHLKLMIAKLRRERFGQSSERGRKLLDQLELQLEELEAAAAEDEAKVERSGGGDMVVRSFTRRRPVRAPLPAHLPRERVVLPRPTACPCCGGKLSKLGEDLTDLQSAEADFRSAKAETLEVVPRQWKVIQTVREKFACRSCEKISQPPAPFHAIARGRAGPGLLAMVLHAKFALHQPLNRQSETYAREGVALDVSTLADWVGACTATLQPLNELIRRHVLAAGRLHGDDTTVPARPPKASGRRRMLARKQTVIGRIWTYVRDGEPLERHWSE